MGELCACARSRRNVFMSDINLKDFSINDASMVFYDNVDSVIVVDPSIDQYKAIVRKGLFEKLVEDTGSYHDLIMKLWFHFGETVD